MNHIGIDVAKWHHQALGLDDAGHIILPPLRFANTRAGVEQFVARLQALPGEPRLAMESTGHYWIALYEYLADRGYAPLIFNPLRIKAYRQVGIRKTKTDRVDSYYIADFLRLKAQEASPMLCQPYRQMRHLARFRFALMDRRAALQRRGHMLLDQVFPEYPTLFTRPFQTTSRTLLQRAVTAEAFATWPLEDLTNVIRQASRGRLGREKAQELHTAARDSLGIISLGAVAQQEMSWLLEQMALLERQMDTLDEILAELYTAQDHFLTSIPGISTVLAATILGEIGDIRRFPNLPSLVAYAGLDPTVYQSGRFQATEVSLSKRGSAYLRRAIWLSAMTARLHNPDLAAFYQRKRRQGKHHSTAMGAVCHRLLARVYVILNERRPYQVR